MAPVARGTRYLREVAREPDGADGDLIRITTKRREVITELAQVRCCPSDLGRDSHGYARALGNIGDDLIVVTTRERGALSKDARVARDRSEESSRRRERVRDPARGVLSSARVTQESPKASAYLREIDRGFRRFVVPANNP